MTSFFRDTKDAIVDEFQSSWEAIRQQKMNLAFAFACFCIGLVIIGNVVLLISINFWISILPLDNVEHNSSQIAIQVVASMIMVLFFAVSSAVFAAIYGPHSFWVILSDKHRVGGRLYRIFLLFAAGATNGLCGVSGVYAMSHTPEFVQAVLLCSIPFSAQAWTLCFIPMERQRNYLSLFFISSAVLFIAGVLLSSLSAFINEDAKGQKAPWSWALVYLASCVLFGLWCVVQRLYLDAMVKVAPQDIQDVMNAERQSEQDINMKDTTLRSGEPIAEEVDSKHAAERVEKEREEGDAFSLDADKPVAVVTDEHGDKLQDERESHHMMMEDGTAMKRSWGRQSIDDNAAKLVLLLGGLIFQLLVSFVVFPVDAIPRFGTSNSVQEAWHGFADSVDFLFASWHNIRYGLLYCVGYIMSFIGCTFLNEHSPTLASLVLQLAGPLTSLVLIINPKWDVYETNANIGQKVGGVILLLVAALIYHVWEQQSVKHLLRKQEGAAIAE